MQILIVFTGIIMVIFFFLWQFYANQHLEVTHYEINSKKIPEQFHNCKLVLISDLHNNSFGNHNQKLLTAIDKENPDFIIVAGDMIIGKKNWEPKNSISLLKNLSKKYQIFYGNGNHEQKLYSCLETRTSYEEYCKQIKKMGIYQLINESVYLERNKAKIRITGLEIPKDYFKKYNRPEMTKEILTKYIEIPKDKQIYQILIAHNPMYFPKYAAWGADLVLSGHVHGGILKLPFLGGIVSPQYELFPKYDSGLFKEKESFMVLSRGLGVHTIKIRIFNRPELAVVQFKRK